jgi:hypothetical protein
MPKSAIADDQRVIKLPKRKEVTWYENDYGFGPTFVLYVGKVAPIFIAILDWHAAVKHFQPSAFSSGGKCKDENAREFVTLFTRVKKTSYEHVRAESKTAMHRRSSRST